MAEKFEMEFAGQTLSIETGRVAKQAHGSVWLQYGDTVVLVAVVADGRSSNSDFFPLTVDYREKMFAGGRIPGNFFKREGAPTTTEKLHARLIDHQIRSLFPKAFKFETQVLVSVLSYDGENDPAVLAMLGASAALSISDIPFDGPIGAVRVGRIDGEYKLLPTYSELDDSDMDIVVSGNRDSVVAVEGECHEATETDVLEAIRAAHRGIVELIDFQEKVVATCGRAKREVVEPEVNVELVGKVTKLAEARVRKANRVPVKEERENAIRELIAELQEQLEEEYADEGGIVADTVNALIKADMRLMILDDKKRIDNRRLDEIRPITIELGVLPRAHGSAIFTRGQTQALCVTTLGGKMDTRMVDDLEGKSFKSFMLDYNFPSFSVGETRRIGAPGRREIGHGALAEKAIEPVVPSEDTFPYTIRTVSEILESNSSSSMATVCGGSLSLMDAGVPIRTHVAGAGVGLVTDGDRWEVLTDILGDEDHLGDMDLKVAGTSDGITSVQMDIKVKGISFEIMETAFQRARTALDFIIGLMNDAIAKPRESLSQYAPRILSTKVDTSKIGTIIGPGGKTIRSIEEFGVSVSVDDDGTVTVTSVDVAAAEEAMQMIKALVADPEVGQIYEGVVKRVTDFGAFIEILPGKDGLCHISELEYHRVGKVEDVLKEGDRTKAKVIGVDDQGKIRLSRKATMVPPEGYVEPEGGSGPPPRRSGGGGRRGGGQRR